MVLLVTSFALRATAGAGTHTASCSGDLRLSVEVAPEVAAAVRSAAGDYQKTAPAVDGRCVTVQVATRASHETARLLGGGWLNGAAGAQPDVWIPDSTAWLELARLAEPARSLLPENGTTVAESPVVVAMPRPMAESLGWIDNPPSWRDFVADEGDVDFWKEHGHDHWGPFRVVLANPQASSAGADAMLSSVSAAVGLPVPQLTREMVGENLLVKKVMLDLERRSAAIPASDEVLLTELRTADSGGHLLDYLSAAPMPESAVFDYNRGLAADGKFVPPGKPLVAVYPAGGTMVHEVPFVTLTAASSDPARAVAADGFLHALLGETGQAAFTAEGLRTPAGTNPRLTPDAGFSPDLRFNPAGVAGPETRGTALTTFGRLQQRGTSLVVFDTSSSMGQAAPGDGGRTRLEVATDAVQEALGLLAADSDLGVWQSASDTDGAADHRELIPLGPMDGDYKGVTRSVAATGAIRSIKPGSNTGLYDTALAAFRALTAAYTPGRPNQVVFLTDGRNDDPGGISPDELAASVKREFDPERPVRLITIAYGNDADAAALRRVSDATGAKSYPALDSRSIFQVVIDVLSPR
jgi:Ca-activated chloride channel family protein